MSDARRPGEERSLGELFGDLTREVTTLVREEVALAKAELTTKARRAGKDAGMIAAGGAIAYGGFLTLLAAVVFILAALGVPLWLSALLVGIAVTAGGGFLAWKGLDALKKEDLAPRETVEALTEDVSEQERPAVRRRAA
ncbi:MAG: phage holin family protein [Armatimonadota bacterium]